MSDELMLDSMGATPTGFEIKTHAGGPESAATLLFIADSIRSVLDGHDAPNYVEMEVKGTDGKGYILTLQRQGKVTPHKARMAAEESLASAVDLVRALTDREDCSFDHHGGCQAHGYLDLQPGELCPQFEAKALLHNHAKTPSE